MEMVNVRVALAPLAIAVVLKSLLRVGSARTVTPLVVTLFVIRTGRLMLPIVLLYGPPGTLLVTFTVIVQVAWANVMSAFVTVITPEPGKAVAETLGQVPPTPAGFAITKLVGSVSTNEIPVCAGLLTPLVNVNVSTDVPP